MCVFEYGGYYVVKKAKRITGFLFDCLHKIEYEYICMYVCMYKYRLSMSAWGTAYSCVYVCMMIW